MFLDKLSPSDLWCLYITAIGGIVLVAKYFFKYLTWRSYHQSDNPKLIPEDGYENTKED